MKQVISRGLLNIHNQNLVEYNNSLMTVNKFCRACINERLPDIKKSNINVGITVDYVNIKNENGELNPLF